MKFLHPILTVLFWPLKTLINFVLLLLIISLGLATAQYFGFDSSGYISSAIKYIDDKSAAIDKKFD